jgi:hypothetical protein
MLIVTGAASNTELEASRWFREMLLEKLSLYNGLFKPDRTKKGSFFKNQQSF